MLLISRFLFSFIPSISTRNLAHQTPLPAAPAAPAERLLAKLAVSLHDEQRRVKERVILAELLLLPLPLHDRLLAAQVDLLEVHQVAVDVPAVQGHLRRNASFTK